MAQLIKPNKDKHQYVIGIDFGHGETSAAICELEWNKSAGTSEQHRLDIDMDRSARKKVLVSAICKTPNGRFHIGNEAFEADNLVDGTQLSVCFKQAPKDINGEKEQLMIAYMRTIYERILNYEEKLVKDNHIVYIARPSGWIDENTKELYRQMALNAGIPLGGLTSESRAAIFYAMSPNVGFAKEVAQGAIVFDLGSSTLDFTYLSDNAEEVVDYGYDLGASIIEQNIYEHIILPTEGVKEFVNSYPQYTDTLRFQARMIKEEVYSKDPETRTVVKFGLDKVMSDDCEDFEKYEDVDVKVRFKNVDELNTLIEEKSSYISRMKNAMIDFRDNQIPNKKVHGVFLTGGASRMNFIVPLVMDVFNLPQEQVKIDNDNPSLTISRGIASLGVADVITDVLISELDKHISGIVNKTNLTNQLIEKISLEIPIESWKVVEKACKRFRDGEGSREYDTIKYLTEKELEIYKNGQLKKDVSKIFKTFLNEESEVLRKKVNKIISYYAPGREIKSVTAANNINTQSIDKELDKMANNIAEICAKNTEGVISKVLWAAFGYILFGLFYVGYKAIKWVWNLFRDEWDKRWDMTHKIESDKDKIILQISDELKTQLSSNENFKNVVSNQLGLYFNKLVEENLKQVRIPIE